MKNAQHTQRWPHINQPRCQPAGTGVSGLIPSTIATANCGRREFVSVLCTCAGVLAVSYLPSMPLLAQANTNPPAQNASIEERVNAIIVHQLEVKPEQVVPSARYIQDLGADSLDVVELVMAFEEAFDIEISEDEALKIFTVQDTYDCIHRLVKK